MFGIKQKDKVHYGFRMHDHGEKIGHKWFATKDALCDFLRAYQRAAFERKVDISGIAVTILKMVNGDTTVVPVGRCGFYSGCNHNE